MISSNIPTTDGTLNVAQSVAETTTTTTAVTTMAPGGLAFFSSISTSNLVIVHYCQTVFDCELPSVLSLTRYEKFITKLTCNSV